MVVDYNENFTKLGSKSWVKCKDSMFHLYIEVNYDCGYLYPSVRAAWDESNKELYKLDTGIVGLETKVRINVNDLDEAEHYMSLAPRLYNEYKTLKSKSWQLEINYPKNAVKKVDLDLGVKGYQAYLEDGEYIIAVDNHPIILMQGTKVTTDLSPDTDQVMSVIFELPKPDPMLLSHILRERLAEMTNMNIEGMLNAIIALREEFGILLKGVGNTLSPIQYNIEGIPGDSYVQFLNIMK